MVSMPKKLIQTVVRVDRDLVITISTEDGKMLSRRIWKGAASYIIGEKESKSVDSLVLAIPKKVGLKFK